jgi:signal transduction histidine kinase
MSLNQTYTKERLQLVLESTRLGMWDWNPQTNEVVFDEIWASMLGLTLNDLTMTLDDWSSRVHPDDIDSCFADITAHLDGKTPFYENLHRMRHASGQWLYILDRGRVVDYDSEGNAIRFTGTHADLTPLKHAEFQASLAMKDRERFFAAVSHELRAPLHAIQGVHGQLLEEETDRERLLLLKLASDAATSLTSVVNDLLDASAIGLGKLVAKKSRFDLIQLLESLVSLFERRFDEKGLSLTLSLDQADIGSEPLLIETDKSRLNQMLTNLVSNALKFTVSGGADISISTTADDVTIRVKDTGVGMEDVDTIFSPYFTTPEPENDYDDTNSTGLGLFIVRELSTLLDASLEVESTPGQGSTFIITLRNVRRSRLIGMQLSPEGEIPAPHLAGKKILIVDDDLINLKFLDYVLSRCDAEVFSASNGLQAIDKLAELGSVDLVISDLHMPEMGGFKLSGRLRTEAQHNEIPIVLTSADSELEIRDKLVAAGITRYLQKPFSSNDVRTLLWEVLKLES